MFFIHPPARGRAARTTATTCVARDGALSACRKLSADVHAPVARNDMGLGGFPRHGHIR